MLMASTRIATSGGARPSAAKLSKTVGTGTTAGDWYAPPSKRTSTPNGLSETVGGVYTQTYRQLPKMALVNLCRCIVPAGTPWRGTTHGFGGAPGSAFVEAQGFS